MKLIKTILGFNSEYSWMKWLRISFAILALIIAWMFWSNLGLIVMDGGIVEAIIALIIFLIFFGPILLIMLGITVIVGMVIGGTLSGVKQRKSYKETAATGSPELMELEKLRLKCLTLNYIFIAVVIVLVVLAFFLFEPLYDTFGAAGCYGYAILAGILLLGFQIAASPVKTRYKKGFKEQVVVKGLSEVLSNMDFRPEEKLPKAVVDSAGLFSHYDIYNGNDYLKADYNGRHFIQSDIHLQKNQEETYVDKGGNIRIRTVTVTLFRGRLVVFDFDAISNEPVAVHNRGDRKLKNKEMIQTELEAFNKKFYITAPSPTAAFRILTPPVLEGIVLTADKLGFPLHLSFNQDKLYVALENGDTLEASVGDVTLSEQRRRVAWEIQTILDLADTIYLKNQPQEGGTS